MKIMISGHRKEKLLDYDSSWIKEAIRGILLELQENGQYLRGLSGMASGVDLWFCQICQELGIPYVACIPFAEQSETMGLEDKLLRDALIKSAAQTQEARNSYMVENCDTAIVVWDGNKGGTHNCFQQLIEAKKDFWWINPVKETIIKC